MRLEQLHYLLVTADCHSMRKAAESLHVSQQNISKAIKDLESELNTLLFERTSNGLFLTNAGEKVYLLAFEMLEKANKITHLFQTTPTIMPHKQLKGDFTAVTLPGNSNFLYKSMMQFKESCPNISFYLEEREALDVINCLLTNHYEWGMTTLDQLLQLITAADFWSYYDVYILKQDMLKVLTSASSPLAQFQAISNKQLAQYPIIFYTTAADKQNFTEKILNKHHLAYQTFLHTNSHLVFNDALLKNHAIAISSNFIFQTAVRENQDQLMLLPLHTRLPINHVIIKKKLLSPIGEIFHHFFLQSLADFHIQPVLFTPDL